MIEFNNTYARLPEHFYAQVKPDASSAPQLLAWNSGLAEQLGLSELASDAAEVFGGNAIPDGAQPIALAYAGHQFGNFVPQLGDGRALLLGEVVDANGQRVDIQLKGSGPTPFSRRGDGKAALGPVIREYLVSEAMHRLGVPTTRALAAVLTGDAVLREGRQPGAVLTRIAASHIRVGTFEYFAAREDKDAIQTLTDYAINRHYPQAAQAERPAVEFFRLVAKAQAELVAHWMDIGFIHGVMNTDNVSVAGQTIDYGPCAFMDAFNYSQVFSSIDQFGRYAYGKQASIAHWNLTRLAECLLLLGDPQADFEKVLKAFPPLFEKAYRQRMARKLGFAAAQEGDDALLTEWLQYLQDNALDYTLSHRQLADRIDAEDDSQFGEFEPRWRARVTQRGKSAEQVRSEMNAINPLYIPRNHQIERAIQAATVGDMSVFKELHQVLQQPFTEQLGKERYAQPPAPSEVVSETFCGT